MNYHLGEVIGEVHSVAVSGQPKLRVRVDGHGDFDTSAHAFRVVADSLSLQLGEGARSAIGLAAGAVRRTRAAPTGAEVAVQVDAIASTHRFAILTPKSVLSSAKSHSSRKEFLTSWRIFRFLTEQVFLYYDHLFHKAQLSVHSFNFTRDIRNSKDIYLKNTWKMKNEKENMLKKTVFNHDSSVKLDGTQRPRFF